jgi:hypothetical protein
MTIQSNEIANRYSRHAFGGDESLAYAALSEHESKMVIGANVRAYRRSSATGAIVEVNGHNVTIEEGDGLRVIVEACNLELV